MFRVSLAILALASVFALNGCSQCSRQEPVDTTTTTTTTTTTEATTEATPVEAMAMPADVTAPAATPATEMTPAQ